MLIEFMVENYLSFREQNVFSMISTTDDYLSDIQTVKINSKNKILKNAASYGANASGKSNLLMAISFMKAFVINSSKESQQGDLIEVQPFKFNTITEKEASQFEVVFSCDTTIYRYGFEVIKEKVVSEWLFARYNVRESQLFVRDGQKITIGDKFKEGKKYIESVRENAFFLSVCAQFNGVISIAILKWFRKLNVISSLDEDYVPSTMRILENVDQKYDEQKRLLISLITGIDVGIQDIIISENENTNIKKVLESLPMKLAQEVIGKLKIEDLQNLEEGVNKHKFISKEISAVHKKFDMNGNFVGDVSHNFGIESRGTQKIFELAGPIIDTMYNGGILFIDEIQNSLHTKLVLGLVDFFVKNKLNINAQVIFTTHDVNILDANILRRDQFWFVEKNEYGESELTCLVDFEEHVRKDANIDKDYLRGRYGAIPYLKLGELNGY